MMAAVATVQFKWDGAAQVVPLRRKAFVTSSFPISRS